MPVSRHQFITKCPFSFSSIINLIVCIATQFTLSIFFSLHLRTVTVYFFQAVFVVSFNDHFKMLYLPPLSIGHSIHWSVPIYGVAFESNISNYILIGWLHFPKWITLLITWFRIQAENKNHNLNQLESVIVGLVLHYRNWKCLSFLFIRRLNDDACYYYLNHFPRKYELKHGFEMFIDRNIPKTVRKFFVWWCFVLSLNVKV